MANTQQQTDTTLLPDLFVLLSALKRKLNEEIIRIRKNRKSIPSLDCCISLITSQVKLFIPQMENVCAKSIFLKFQNATA